ncbi:MAG: ATP-dependent DNA helicase RecG [Actinomycetota bacterium]
MVEPCERKDDDETLTLTPASPISAIDRRLASRRMGAKSKGPPAAEVVADGLGIDSVGALLHHYPRSYIDRSEVDRIRDLKIGSQATVISRIKRVSRRQGRNRKAIVTVTLYDGTGYLDLLFFNQPWAANQYKEGMEVAASGVVAIYRGRLQLHKHEVEILRSGDDTVHSGRITPVHSVSEGISTRTLRELVFRALEQLPVLEDPLPASVVEAEALPSYDRAIRDIHFPREPEELARARDRLKFDELFVLELGVAFRKRRVETETVGVAHDAGGPLAAGLVGELPFELTGAQGRAIDEVRTAMQRSRPMNLLLQGDVGAGKTVVALAAALVAIDSGHQAAVMAPTEVLAAQHICSMTALLQRIGAVPFLERPETGASSQPSLLDDPTVTAPTMTFALLTGSVTGKRRARVIEAIADGSVDLVVGTHALVQEGVTFKDLSLAVIDEQHRFGVHQRIALKGKGVEPDVVIMTATPIPRTLALTYYGDLDVVVLDELPAGRRPVQTRVVRTAAQRRAAEEVIRTEVAAGRQAFVVCAAIDEDNRTQVKAAEVEAERLATEVFPDLRVDVLHGRMRSADKERRMEVFAAGESDVLISTTVIEVGVDVPNATVMLVENAERFGLAQLHQLRGRIGRSTLRSFCFLVDESEAGNGEAKARLQAMVATQDGFALADEDLRLRGEGTLFDVRQSGMPDLKLARLADDLGLVRRARAQAFETIDADPDLGDHPGLLEELRRRFQASIDWLFHS